MNLKGCHHQLETMLTKVGTLLLPVVLLIMRLFRDWQFFQTGKGKLMSLDCPAGFFACIDIPWPKVNAVPAGMIETAGGLLLMAGLPRALHRCR